MSVELITVVMFGGLLLFLLAGAPIAFVCGAMAVIMTVLVLGTGGVSVFALLLARLAGARVVVTSSSDARLERVRELGAWETVNYVSEPEWDRRVRELIEGEVNLLAYHLPLDRHPTFGNNVLAAEAFGLVDLEPFAPHKGTPIGFYGRFEEPLPAAELIRRCAEVYGQEPLVYDAGPDPVRTLGIVSGGAERQLNDAIAAGLDAFVTGEVSEWVMNVARESGIHFLAAGHYATERVGIRTLGEHLADRFGLEVEFVDLPNPA